MAISYEKAQYRNHKVDAIAVIQEPRIDRVIALIDRSPKLADTTKDKYKHIAQEYLESGRLLTNPFQLAGFADSLPPSRRTHLKSVVRLWTKEAEHYVKATVHPTPEDVAVATATLMKLEALNDAVYAPQPLGQKTHEWLEPKEVERLLQTCDGSVKGKRDRIVLGLLVGAGLRRTEASQVTFSNIKYQPIGGYKRAVLAIEGKGARKRSVPISADLSDALSGWCAFVGDSERIARSVHRNGELGKSLSVIGIFKIVREHGEAIDKPKLAPHDLRRTYAQLGYENGVPVSQISRLLGHSSIVTTQRYLNLEIDLDKTASDYVPFM